MVLIDPLLGFDFPGGKIQEGETDFKSALKREVKEETGLGIEVGNPFITWYFKFPKGHRNYPKTNYQVGFRCKYISGDVKISDEHTSYVWVDEDNYQDFKQHINQDYLMCLTKYFKRNV